MSGQGLDGHIIFHHALNLAASLGTRGLLEGSWMGLGGVLEGSWRGLEGSLRAQQIICPPRVWADIFFCCHTLKNHRFLLLFFVKTNICSKAHILRIAVLV